MKSMKTLGCFSWADQNLPITLVGITCCYNCHFGIHDKSSIRGHGLVVCCSVAKICLNKCLCTPRIICTACGAKASQ